MFTRAGWVSANITDRTTSSGSSIGRLVSAVCSPGSVTVTLFQMSVFVAAGEMSVVRTPVPRSSALNTSWTARSPNLAAE